MRDGQAARRLHGLHGIGAIVAHPRHEDRDTFLAEFFCDGPKQHVHRWPVSVHRRLIHKRNHVSLRRATNLHVTIARAYERAPGAENVAGQSLRHVNRRALVQPARTSR